MTKLSAGFQPQKVSVAFTGQSLGIDTGTPIVRELVERDPYTGDYAVTPSSETQVLQTKNLRMTDDITINPIPQNYGLITWDGSIITVS